MSSWMVRQTEAMMAEYSKKKKKKKVSPEKENLTCHPWFILQLVKLPLAILYLKYSLLPLRFNINSQHFSYLACHMIVQRDQHVFFWTLKTALPQ